MLKNKLISTFVCAILLALSCHAQFQAVILDQNGDIIENRTYADSTSFLNSISRVKQRFQLDGYLDVSITQSGENNNQLIYQVIPGVLYKWGAVNVTGTLPASIRRLGFSKTQFEDERFDIRSIKKSINKLLVASENNGYPFASISFDSVQINNGVVTASINYDPGIYIVFGALLVSNEGQVKPEWLKAYLNLRTGEPFSRQEVENIEDKIAALAFLQLIAPPRITYKNEQAEITLELEALKVNQVDGIIGFFPNERANGSLLVTGQFDLELHNLFRSGNQAEIHWKSIKPRSQQLDLAYHHRNVLRSPLDFLGSFSLLKEDSFFLNRTAQLGLSYAKGRHSVNFYSRFVASRNLTSVEAAIAEQRNDVDLSLFGLAYTYQVRQFRMGVPKSTMFSTSFDLGNKDIISFPEQSDFYDSLQLRSTQIGLTGSFQMERPVLKNLGFYWALEGAKLFNDYLFVNDLYRLGGLNSIRGFNENNFFADTYLMSRLEGRFYFEEVSYLFLFYDQGFLQNSLSQTTQDTPLGIGAGLTIQTGFGQLQLVYALGQSDVQPLTFNLSKFHFGYVAKF